MAQLAPFSASFFFIRRGKNTRIHGKDQDTSLSCEIKNFRLINPPSQACVCYNTAECFDRARDGVYIWPREGCLWYVIGRPLLLGDIRTTLQYSTRHSTVQYVTPRNKQGRLRFTGGKKNGSYCTEVSVECTHSQNKNFSYYTEVSLKCTHSYNKNSSPWTSFFLVSYYCTSRCLVLLLCCTCRTVVPLCP